MSIMIISTLDVLAILLGEVTPQPRQSCSF